MKQAVVVIHGMGEQIPMQTLRGFVNTVWVNDETLVDDSKPDPNTGGNRDKNAIWSKPDKRNRSYELHRMTTEQDDAGGRTDFFEFYWAHLVYGTKLDQLKSWIFDILWRNPFRRVPKRVFNVWIALWLVTLVIVGIALYTALPDAAKAAPSPVWLKLVKIAAGLIVSAAIAWFVNTVMIKIFGDVVRYTGARPENIACRQNIREKGVELLETLMGVGLPASAKKPYDRIVVVAHSLGSIVAYDILILAFAREVARLPRVEGKPQPHLEALEDMIRDAIKRLEDGQAAGFSIDDFQLAQARALEELCEVGSKWIVTDFLTLGSPLSHADFLMAYDEKDLHTMQDIRQFSTCPPTMEYDMSTKQGHFAYRDPRGSKKNGGRIPHHGGAFGFTRWTNIYSPRKWLIFGDVVSGPVGPQFGLNVRDANTSATSKLSGIRDLAVLPERTEDGEVKPGHSVPFMTHTRYWDMNANTGAPTGTAGIPHHIETLRGALDILRKQAGEE